MSKVLQSWQNGRFRLEKIFSFFTSLKDAKFEKMGGSKLWKGREIDKPFKNAKNAFSRDKNVSKRDKNVRINVINVTKTWVKTW